MYKKFDPHAPYFLGVAMAMIIAGAGVLTVGAVEWMSNVFLSIGFSSPTFKIIGGLVVIALGYIQLELELIRTSRK